jgi:hypothetical protein
MGLKWDDIFYASKQEIDGIPSGPTLDMYSAGFKNLTFTIGFDARRAKAKRTFNQTSLTFENASILTVDLQRLVDEGYEASACFPALTAGARVVVDGTKDFDIDKEISGLNRTIELDSINKTSLVDILEIKGNISFISPFDSANLHQYKLWNQSSYIYTGSCVACWVRTDYGDELKQIDVYAESIFGKNKSFVVFVNFFNTLYQHFSDNLVGNMVLIKLLNESLLVDYADSIILVPERTVIADMLSLLLANESSFANRILYYPVGQKIYFEDSKIGVLTFRPYWVGYQKTHFLSRNPSAVALSRLIVENLLPQQTCRSMKVVYISRSVHLANGRSVGNENDVISLIRSKMQQYSRSEEFEVFITPGSIREQIDLFRCAKVIIGAHGGGVSNAFWTRPSHNCSEPVHIVETICGSRSWKVQDHCPYSRSFFNILGGVPWVKYSMLLFTKKSSPTITFIPIEALSFSLDTIWSPEYVMSAIKPQQKKYMNCGNETEYLCSETQLSFLFGGGVR